ncbi:MAG: hypothetical protein WC683_11110 [bacterium]
MSGVETLIMPRTISPTFAAGFTNLASWSGALPISHFEIARIGLDAPPTDPLPPLIAIDGSPRPERAPKLALKTADAHEEGYEADWNELQDMLDLPPSAVEEFGLNLMELGRARDAGWLSRYNSIREMLAPDEISHKARVFFAEAFDAHSRGIITPLFNSSTNAVELVNSQNEHGGYNHSLARNLPSTDKKEMFYVAKSRFVEGAFIAGINWPGAFAQDRFFQSAMGFGVNERFSAAAMMYELARDALFRDGFSLAEMREEFHLNELRTEEAKMWLKELKRGDASSFDAIYPRALNAAQVDHPGNGLLEGIFEASTAHYLERGDNEETARAFLRTAWARIMKLDAPNAAPILSSSDWFRTATDILTAGTFLNKSALTAYASMAQKLSAEAYGFGDGIVTVFPSLPPRSDETVRERPSSRNPKPGPAND